MKTPQPQTAMAAAKAPTAPPIKAIAFGIDPAGARPVLGVATAPDPDLEGDFASVPELVGDGVPVAEADPGEDAPLAVTKATTWYTSKSCISLCDRTLDVAVSVPKLGMDPRLVTSQVKSAVVIAPCQLQAMSTVHAPGVGSVRCISYVSGPCRMV
jgi:hypothetical protein